MSKSLPGHCPKGIKYDDTSPTEGRTFESEKRSTDPGKIKQDDECLKQHILKILTS